MLPLILVFLLVLISCKPSSRGPQAFTCEACHKVSPLNLSHSQLTCKDCHSGSSPAPSKERAHQGLKRTPSHEEVEAICRGCHPGEVLAFKGTAHSTYAGELKDIFKGFNLKIKVDDIKGLLPLEGSTHTEEGLLIDFLKRRCLSCHILSEGERYPSTYRAKGCFSCHRPHQLGKPGDEECLSCHYGTKIGWDYYGYSPHPWFVDYRSPFIKGKQPERPYGIEAYNLKEDIHKEKGLACKDCHTKQEIMYGKEKIECLGCHKGFKEKRFHQKKILQKVRCEVCHASFLSMDKVKRCYLEDKPDLKEWIDLSVQESAEIEEIMRAFGEGKSFEIKMRDKFTGKEKEGLWLCTLEGRRFDELILGKDRGGRFCLLRKERLTLVYGEREISATFENCKTPHSIGKADLNRSLKILKELP